MDGPASEAPLAQPTKHSQGSDSYFNTTGGYTYPTLGCDIDASSVKKQQLKLDNRQEISNTQAQLVNDFISDSVPRFSNYGDGFSEHQNIFSNAIFPSVNTYSPYLQQFGGNDPHQGRQDANAPKYESSLYQETFLCPLPENNQDIWNDPSIQPPNMSLALDSTLDGYTNVFDGELRLETGELWAGPSTNYFSHGLEANFQGYMLNSNEAFPIGQYFHEETYPTLTNTIPPAMEVTEKVTSDLLGYVNQKSPPPQSPWFTPEELFEEKTIGGTDAAPTISLADNGLVNQLSHAFPPIINNSPREFRSAVSSSARSLDLSNHENEQLDMDHRALLPARVSSLRRPKNTKKGSTKTRVARGRRNGRLSEQARIKALNVKKKGACRRCSRLKLSCSEHGDCPPCLKAGVVCKRSNLSKYTAEFLPPLILNLIPSSANNSNCGTDPILADSIFEVCISHGKLYPSLKVFVTICTPINEPPAEPYFIDDKATYGWRYPVPFDLVPSTLPDLRDKVVVNMDETARFDRDPDELEDDSMTVISFKVLQAIYRYMIATDNKFVVKARGLFAMHWLSTHTLCLNDESEEKFWKRYPASKQSKYHRNLVPRKVTRQIRIEVRKEIRVRTEDVLKELEKKLKSRDKDLVWGPCTCVIAILCICTEMLQVGADSNLVYEMHQSKGGQSTSRDTIVNYCKKLDHFLTNDTITDFHDRQRSHQLNNGKQIQNGFNPPRDGPIGLKQPDEDLANDIRRIWEEHKVEIRERATTRPFDYEADVAELLDKHLNIMRKQTPGRLISVFLCSIFVYGAAEGKAVMAELTS